MSAPCIHHVGIGVADEKPMLKLFQGQLGFEIIAKRFTRLDTKWVLQKNKISFVITKLHIDTHSDYKYNSYTPTDTEQHEHELLKLKSRKQNGKAKSQSEWERKTSSESQSPSQSESLSNLRSFNKEPVAKEKDTHLLLGLGQQHEHMDIQSQSESSDRHSDGDCGHDRGDDARLLELGFLQAQSKLSNNFNRNTFSILDHLSDFSTVWQHQQYCGLELVGQNGGEKNHCDNAGNTNGKFHDDFNCQLSNSVYDICLEVNDVHKSLERAVANGAHVIQPLKRVTSSDGVVNYAIVQSCVGNVQHTIINTDEYHGRFLPGFEDLPSLSLPYKNDHIGSLTYDHITLCVNPGKTFETISWYENCFHMHRLIVNKDESPTNGLMLNDIGMRMAAMEYWRCAESGISLGSSKSTAKFVVAESLSEDRNQVSTFLRQHGGAGIQHIGLMTDNLVKTVRHLKANNVPFLQPPHEYYNEIGKLKEITDCGESVELLEECGILLDSEADCEIENGDMTDDDERKDAYLMQIFTRPIFGDDTFFLEFLQRHGAQGFGAGNITALWKAVSLYMSKDTP